MAKSGAGSPNRLTIRIHPETGQTPAARWQAGEWLPRMPDSLERLDLLLLTVATPRKVQRDGIRCHGLRYFSLTLAAFVGETVTIRNDPRDLAEIRVFHRGEFLCKAVSAELAAVSISIKDLQAARNQRRRELGQQLAARRSVVDILTEPATGPRTNSAPLRRRHGRNRSESSSTEKIDQQAPGRNLRDRPDRGDRP